MLVLNISVMGTARNLAEVTAMLIVAALLAINCRLTWAATIAGAWLGLWAVQALIALHPSSLLVLVSYTLLWVGKFAITIGSAAWLFHTTPLSEVVPSLRASHAPLFLIIPLAVMVRFFPVVFQEFRAVTEAMALRGVTWKTAVFQPLRFVEMLLVPLLSALVQAADELSAAALVRGLGYSKHPTSLRDVRFRLADAIFLVLIALQVSLFIWDGWLR